MVLDGVVGEGAHVQGVGREGHAAAAAEADFADGGEAAGDGEGAADCSVTSVIIFWFVGRREESRAKGLS